MSRSNSVSDSESPDACVTVELCLCLLARLLVDFSTRGGVTPLAESAEKLFELGTSVLTSSNSISSRIEVRSVPLASRGA